MNIFRPTVDRLLASIQLCCDQKFYMSALVLTYSTIDSIAWCVRQDPSGDSTGEDFQRWCNAYMPPGPSEQVSSLDLWAARCAVLHSQGSESRLSRGARATQFFYDCPDGTTLISLGLNAPLMPVRLNLEALVRALTAGYRRFCDALAADPGLSEIVQRESLKWLVAATFNGNNNVPPPT